MTKKLSPHDRFTRSLMTNPKVVEEFFKVNLPKDIQKAIDFSSLELQKDSFIDDHLKLQIADLLYSVKFNGQPGFIYLLIEHASTPDPLLPFRMLKYMVSIMNHHLKARSGNKLPFIYPMILYTGEKPYPYSMDLFDLFPSEEKALAKKTFTSPYRLIDLTQVSDEELKPYLWFGTMALTLKHIHDPDVLPFFEGLLGFLKRLEKQGEESYIYSVVTYMVGAGETPSQESFLQAVKKLETISEEKLMTLAEYFIERYKPEVLKRGMEKGREEGREEGLEEGRKVRDIEIAKSLLSKGISIEIISETTELPKEEIKKLLS